MNHTNADLLFSVAMFGGFAALTAVVLYFRKPLRVQNAWIGWVALALSTSIAIVCLATLAIRAIVGTE